MTPRKCALIFVPMLAALGVVVATTGGPVAPDPVSKPARKAASQAAPAPVPTPATSRPASAPARPAASAAAAVDPKAARLRQLQEAIEKAKSTNPAKARAERRAQYLAVLRKDESVAAKRIAVFQLRNAHLMDEEATRLVLREMAVQKDEAFLKTAAWAVSRVQGAEVTAALLLLVRDEQPPAVRLAAVNALQGRQEPEVTTVLVERYDREERQDLRKGVILALSTRALVDPQAASHLKTVAAKEKDKLLAKLAGEMLALAERVKDKIER